MKARKRDSNDDWQEVEYVQLRNSYVITKADQMEFDTPPNNTYTEDEHWQDVRERAAIAAMQGMLSNPELMENTDWGCRDYRWNIGRHAIFYADSLVEKLKKKNKI